MLSGLGRIPADPGESEEFLGACPAAVEETGDCSLAHRLARPQDACSHAEGNRPGIAERHRGQLPAEIVLQEGLWQPPRLLRVAGVDQRQRGDLTRIEANEHPRYQAAEGVADKYEGRGNPCSG